MGTARIPSPPLQKTEVYDLPVHSPPNTGENTILRAHIPPHFGRYTDLFPCETSHYDAPATTDDLSALFDAVYMRMLLCLTFHWL